MEITITEVKLFHALLLAAINASRNEFTTEELSYALRLGARLKKELIKDQFPEPNHLDKD